MSGVQSTKRYVVPTRRWAAFWQVRLPTKQLSGLFKETGEPNCSHEGHVQFGEQKLGKAKVGEAMTGLGTKWACKAISLPKSLMHRLGRLHEQKITPYPTSMAILLCWCPNVISLMK